MSDTSMRIISSPQIHHEASTAKVMWSVVICLVPSGIWGIAVFGLKALWVVLVSIGSAALAEYLMGLIFKRFTLWDGSAVLTGLLVGYNMPPGVPLFIPLVASVFAIVVVKWTFGGLGSNIMNPALAGRAFVFFSWTGFMTTWNLPKTLVVADAVTGPTPLGFIKTGLMDFAGKAKDSMDFLSQGAYPHSGMDAAVTNWLHTVGINIPGGYFDLFIGNKPGCIGEVSVLLLLVGTIYLFVKKIITWEIPVAYLASFGILTWMFGGLRFGNGLFTGDVVFHMLTGGLVLGVFYMATDMVTSPLTSRGMIIYGIGAGFFTFLIRLFGSFPEGVSLAILLLNMCVPLINRFPGLKRFGMVKKEKLS